ncbi:MAG: cysteinyl-tRNA synthetase [Bacteroidetes bacterium]|nr:cysteinyl-tRNA synthetase [Bacteroidota bacterium]
MSLRVYNTLSRTKEEFIPLHPPHVGIYVCGPTVYGHSHLGHAKSYVSFDVIVRYLRHSGYKVLYVQNITDVGHLSDDADMGEDKIEKQSRLDRVHPMQLAETYTRSYFEDMDALGVLRPDISPRATGHITEQIELIRRLIDAGSAYESGGSVYFDIGSFAAYGKLSGRTVDEMSSGIRVEVRSEKRHPADFALWKRADAGHIMRWTSPWGEGFPGWHIECSAMSMKYLGESIDIHGGGLENQFPHHESEIAQSEAATRKPFIKYWLHNNMVTVDGRKMGKSLNNFVTLKDAFATWHPRVVRLFILQSHYRSPLDFSKAALDGAAKGLEKIDAAVLRLRTLLREGVVGSDAPVMNIPAYRSAFADAMDDDFNAPRAVAVVFDFLRELNTMLSGSRPPAEALREIDEWITVHAGGVLGIDPGTEVATAGAEHDVSGLMNLLIALRQEVRRQKLWPLADRIRDGLGALGITLEDGKDGTTWKKTS